MADSRSTEVPLARLGNVEVSKYETATGARLRLRRVAPHPVETYLDPLELEGLTRVRYKAFPLLDAPRPDARRTDAPSTDATRTDSPRPTATRLEPLQNEFAMVGVGVTTGRGGEGLLIRDMNAGQVVVFSAGELEALLRARHRDFAPLVDTSDLIAIPEPDIDEA